jgi:hypothetical protein
LKENYAKLNRKEATPSVVLILNRGAILKQIREHIFKGNLASKTFFASKNAREYFALLNNVTYCFTL